jgi:hypothetical protein
MNGQWQSHGQGHGNKPDGVPPVEPDRPSHPPKHPNVPPVDTPRNREVKPEKPHGGMI